jgi:hypothetical protein
MKKCHDRDTAISDIGGIVVPRNPAVYRVGNVAHEVEDGQGLTGCAKLVSIPASNLDGDSSLCGKPSVHFLGRSESGDTSSVRLARCFGGSSQPVRPWASDRRFNSLVAAAYER